MNTRKKIAKELTKIAKSLGRTAAHPLVNDSSEAKKRMKLNAELKSLLAEVRTKQRTLSTALLDASMRVGGALHVTSNTDASVSTALKGARTLLRAMTSLEKIAARVFPDSAE